MRRARGRDTPGGRALGRERERTSFERGESAGTTSILPSTVLNADKRGVRPVGRSVGRSGLIRRAVAVAAAAAARPGGRPGKNYARSRGRCSSARSSPVTCDGGRNRRTPQQADRSVAGRNGGGGVNKKIVRRGRGSDNVRPDRESAATGGGATPPLWRRTRGLAARGRRSVRPH